MMWTLPIMKKIPMKMNVCGQMAYDTKQAVAQSDVTVPVLILYNIRVLTKESDDLNPDRLWLSNTQLEIAISASTKTALPRPV